MFKKKLLFYYMSITIIFVLGAVIRLNIVDLDRQIKPHDEMVYHYAAENLLKYGTLTFEVDGAMFHGDREVTPASNLQPGYPLYIAAIYSVFGHASEYVFISQLILSIISLYFIYRLLVILNVKKHFIIMTMLLASLYPGLIYNIDRMLTEQLFSTLLLAYAYLFLKGLKENKLSLLCLSFVLIMYASHVRALAFPFVLLSLFIILIHDRGKLKQSFAKFATLSGVVLLFMIPWWIRNYITLHEFYFFSNAGFSPKIWGAVPYFLNMGATSQSSFEEIVQSNMSANPILYYKWRILGFFQYMWGDIWDENIVHPIRMFRPILAVQQFIIVPCVAAIPFLIRKSKVEVLFISTFPIAFTLMNMPFHGLPRYVYPSIPFVIILFAVLLDTLMKWIRRAKVPYSAEIEVTGYKVYLNKWFRTAYLGLSITFSIILIYSVYFFAYNINLEMSEYRLNRFADVSYKTLESQMLYSEKSFDESSVSIENALPTNNGKFENHVDAPIIIRLSDSESVDSKVNTISEVNIKIQGGYLFDYMTVYWTGDKTKEISENSVYRFPINPFEIEQNIYIEENVNSLMIVPAVFRGGSFEFDKITIKKYDITK